MCLGPLAVSCVNDDLGCIEDRPGYVEGNDVWISFNIKGETGLDKTIPRSEPFGSRADDALAHPEEDATAAENFILPSDITLIFLDDRRTVIKVFDSDSYTLTQSTTDLSQYTLTAKINQAYFSYSSAAQFDLSLLVIANINGTSDGSFPTGNLFATNLTSLSQFRNSFGFTPEVNGNSWFPNGSDKRIPMAGLKHFSVNRAELLASTDATNRYQLNTEADPLYIQRSIAKLRVFDNVDREDSHLIITDVKLKGVSNRGAFMPDLGLNGCQAWANGTTMLEKATMTANWFDSSVLVNTVLTQKGEEGSGNYTDADGNSFEEAYIAYIPEIDLTAADPILQIYGVYDDGTPNPDKPWEFKLSEIIKEKIDITRNHIYEFTVTASLKAQLDLTLNVKDWDAQETTWDYSDNPAINGEGYLQWLSGTYANIDEANAGLYPRVNYPAVGNFTFSEPQGGEWTAVLIPEGSTELDAFCFVDASGAKVNSISGTIDGSPASISILAQYAPASYDRSARLLFTVHTPDGRTISADVLNGHYGSNKYFTIHQNASL